MSFICEVLIVDRSNKILVGELVILADARADKKALKLLGSFGIVQADCPLAVIDLVVALLGWEDRFLNTTRMVSYVYREPKDKGIRVIIDVLRDWYLNRDSILVLANYDMEVKPIPRNSSIF